MGINGLDLATLKRLGYKQGTSLSEDSLPEALPKFAELRRAGSIKDYLVISLAELTKESKNEGLYEILIKEE